MIFKAASKKLTSIIMAVGLAVCLAGSASPEQAQPAPRIFEKPLFTEQVPSAPEVFPRHETVMIPGGSYTLPKCYTLSLKQSELIAIDADRVKESEARFLQALSIMLPHLTFQSTDIQESIPNDSGTTLSSLKPTKYSERKFNYNQTIFSGFKAFAGMRGSNLERKQRVSEMVRAQQLLLVDVSDAFYTLIEKRKDIEALQMVRKALMKRILELKRRESLGRSRQSEVVNAKAQLYGVEANIRVVENEEDISRQILEFLIGGPVGEIKDIYGIPSNLMPVEYYMSRSSLRPDVEAAKYAWQVAKQAYAIVDSEFLPTVDIGGDYYIQRTGFDKGTDWNVYLKISVPIFEGTETLGRSKEYQLKADESFLAYKRSKRLAPYDIKDAYLRLQTALDVYECQKKTLATSRLNYALQRKDYERSLVNNLEVLAAIQTLQNAESNYIKALYAAKRLYWRLRVAAAQDITESLSDAI